MPLNKSIGNSSTYEKYNRQYEEALKMLELEKKKLTDAEILAAKFLKKGDWWNDSIDNMSSEVLEQFMVSILRIKGV